jgi:hypothetical protein
MVLEHRRHPPRVLTAAREHMGDLPGAGGIAVRGALSLREKVVRPPRTIRGEDKED